MATGSRRSAKKHSQKVGLPPGTLVYTGDKPGMALKVTTVTYNDHDYHEATSTAINSCPVIPAGDTVSWINVNGLGNTEDLEALGSCLHLHPLVLEDILNTDQRPKLDDYGDYLFIVLKMLQVPQGQTDITVEQISLIVGANYVLSFQENDHDDFDIIRERLKAGKGRIRKSGADYLVYALIDLIVDHYFVLLEDQGEVIEDLESKLIANPTPDTLGQIHRLKREMIMLRKSVWPLREVISRLERSESPLIKEPTVLYFKDVYDHIIQIIDNIETFRDILSGMLDIYLSSVSNRLNEVMKVLTIIATIFIPLTFIAGLYGMNFKSMPELEWPHGYYLCLGLMAIVALSMLAFFWRKGWIGRHRDF